MGDSSAPAGAASAYTPARRGEITRLRAQALAVEGFDLETLSTATARFGDRTLVAVDLGCANGDITRSRFAGAQYSHVLGIDRNSDLIGSSNAAASGTKFTFARADLETDDVEQVIAEYLAENNLPGVDVIFSALTLLHLADPVGLLRTCQRVLGEAGTVVLRGSDDGLKAAWPDPNGNVGRIIELTMASPGVSDRLNGRKLYSQLHQAGFRDIHTGYFMQDTAGATAAERSAIFHDSFSYRTNYLAQQLENGPDDPALRADLAEMVRRLGELERDFADDGFFFLQTAFGVTGHIG